MYVESYIREVFSVVKVSEHIYFFIVDLSNMTLLMYCIHVSNILRQSLLHIRHAFETWQSDNRCRPTVAAWSISVPAVAVGHTRSENEFTETRNVYKTISSLNRITYETFVEISQLYSGYFCFGTLGYILWVSYEIIFAAAHGNIANFIVHILVWLLADVFLLFNYASINSELRYLEGCLLYTSRCV